MNTPKFFLVPAVFFAMVSVGCTKDQVSRSLYEGLSSDSTLKQDPARGNPPYDRPMTYDQYEAERKRVLKEGADDTNVGKPGQSE